MMSIFSQSQGSELLWSAHRDPALRTAAPSPDVRAYHARLPGYAPTRLVRLRAVEEELGFERVWVKDESSRLGLPAFKVLGVSWAVYRLLSRRLGRAPAEARTLDELREAFRPALPLTLVSATAGNHGRALARVARWLGCEARILVPSQAPPARIAAIRAEGALVEVVEGGYDDAVAAAAELEGGDGLVLVSDTATVDGEQIPTWVCDGYTTLFAEVDEQLAAAGEAPPDLVLVQAGVGSLAAAAATHFRQAGRPDLPTLVAVEPARGDCLLESARAGELREAPGPFDSLMDCLDVARPSATSLDLLLRGYDAFAAVEDGGVPAAVLTMARHGVVAGATGVAGLVGLRAIAGEERVAGRRALLVNSEGLADPDGYCRALAAAIDGPSGVDA